MNRIASLAIVTILITSIVRADDITIATWNCDMNFGRNPAQQDLDRFEDEVDADVLLLQEVASKTVLDSFLQKLGR